MNFPPNNSRTTHQTFGSFTALIANAKLAKKVTKLLFTKWFSKNVGILFSGVDRTSLNFSRFNMFMYEVSIYFDVFCVFMDDEVIGNMLSGLIIVINMSRTCLRSTKFL